MIINIKRVYDKPSPDDGYRVLVDELWPRGLTKAEADYDLWVKDIEPDKELRQWFHADRADRWEEFKERYAAQLESSPTMRHFVDGISSKPKVTLLYGSKDEIHNQAVVILEVAKKMLATQ